MKHHLNLYLYALKIIMNLKFNKLNTNNNNIYIALMVIIGHLLKIIKLI